MAVLLLLYRAWELLPSPPRFLPVLVLLLEEAGAAASQRRHKASQSHLCNNSSTSYLQRPFKQ